MKLLRFLLAIIFFLTLLGSSNSHVMAASLTVTKTADTDDGICDSDCSLREAIAVAPAGDTINFTSSLAGQTITLQSTLGLEKSVIIDGTSLSPHIKIDGQNLYSAFSIPKSISISIEIKGLDVENCNNSSIIQRSSTLTITNVNFSNNETSNNGGAIFNDDGVLNITDSSFVGNHASGNGGAIANQGEMTITESSFENNNSNIYGGAIYNNRQMSVIDSTFTNNASGAIYTYTGYSNTPNVVVIRSTFTQNSAYGISNDDNGILDVINSTFTNNNGVGIVNSESKLTVKSSTFNNNTGNGISGGIYSYSNGGYLTTLSLTNSILANSTTGVDCYIANTIVTSINNLIETNGSGANACGTPLITGDPKLGPLADNGGSTQTHLLLVGSPAIDAGNDAQCAAEPVNNTSQNGVSRPQGTHCDIGSFESPYTLPPTVLAIARATTNPNASANVNFTVTFSRAVTGVDANDLSLTTSGVSGAAVSGVSGSGTTYTVTVNTGSTDGTIRLDLTDDDSIIGTDSNPLGGPGSGNGDFTNGETYTIDRTPPIISSITLAKPNPSGMASVSFTVNFSEAVTGVDLSDFSLNTTGITGTAISGVSGSGNTRTVTVNTGSGNGTIRLDLNDDDSITDLALNPLNGAGNSTFNTGDAYTITKPNLAAPVLRSPAAGSVTNDSTPTFSWTSVKSGQSYEIQVSTDNTFGSILNSDTVSALTDTLSPAFSDGSYFWRIRAYNAGNQPGRWSVVRTLTIDTTGPAAPTLTSPADNASTSTPTFRWTTVASAVFYQFQYDNDADFSSPRYTTTLRTNSIKPPTISKGTYHWHVRAQDAAGNWSLWSSSRTIAISGP